MKINTNNFKEVIRKATFNNSIDNVQLVLTREKISSKMISSSRDVVATLNIDNNVLNGLKKDEVISLNFTEPSQSLIPFLNLIDEEESDIKIYDEKITIISDTQRSNIHFCSPNIVSVFPQGAPKDDVSYFLEMKLFDDFISKMIKIKKISARFKNIYFNVEDSVFSVETTDKTNRFSNGLKFDLLDMSGVNDLTICFDQINITNILTIMGNDYDQFRFDFSYIEDVKLGMIYIHNSNDTERYYILSKME